MTSSEWLSRLREVQGIKAKLNALEKEMNYSYEDFLFSLGFQNPESELNSLIEPRRTGYTIRNFLRRRYIPLFIVSLVALGLSALFFLALIAASAAPESSSAPNGSLPVAIVLLLAALGLGIAGFILRKKAYGDARSKLEIAEKQSSEKHKQEMEAHTLRKRELQKQLAIYQEAYKTRKDEYDRFLLEKKDQYEQTSRLLESFIAEKLNGEIINFDVLPTYIEYLEKGMASSLAEAKSLYAQALLEQRREEAEAERAAQTARAIDNLMRQNEKLAAEKRRAGALQCATCARTNCHYRNSEGNCAAYRPG